MKNLLPVALLAILVSPVLAQTNEHVSAKTKTYHASRLVLVEPRFGLSKLKRLIAKIKPDKDDNRLLPTREYNALTSREKFTYAMIHAEDEMQNCDVMPTLAGEEHKIFGHEPDAFAGEDGGWSARQRAFLKGDRSEVITLLSETMRANHRVGVNLKNAVVELSAYELIPDMVTIFNVRHADNDILSVLMCLMKDGKYAPFVRSASYEKLYGDKSNYLSYIDGNAANQKLIVDRAMAYYRSRKG